MKGQLYTLRQVVEDLTARANYAGTLKHLGELLDPKRPISTGYLNDVIRGRKQPGPRILKALGLELERGEVLYRRVRPAVKG